MGREFGRNLIRFLAMLLAQVMFFSNVNFSPFINPYVYHLFILLLPYQLPRQIQLILGLAIGLTLDMFLGSPGLHSAAAVLLAYIRPFIINLITPKGTEFEISPNIYSQGISWFLIYLFITTFIHHFFYFIIEAAGFYNFLLLLLKIFLSTLSSVAFMIILLYLFSKNRKRG
jgi:hypothetical protein